MLSFIPRAHSDSSSICVWSAHTRLRRLYLGHRDRRLSRPVAARTVLWILEARRSGRQHHADNQPHLCDRRCWRWAQSDVFDVDNLGCERRFPHQRVSGRRISCAFYISLSFVYQFVLSTRKSLWNSDRLFATLL